MIIYNFVITTLNNFPYSLVHLLIIYYSLCFDFVHALNIFIAHKYIKLQKLKEPLDVLPGNIAHTKLIVLKHPVSMLSSLLQKIYIYTYIFIFKCYKYITIYTSSIGHKRVLLKEYRKQLLNDYKV